MFQSIVLAVVLAQCPTTDTVLAPTLYIDYNLGGMTEVSRCMAVIRYSDGRKWRVPVINGYVPSITHTRYANGSERYYFDYRINKTYGEVFAEARKWELKRQREQEQAKILPEPLPVPEPPRPDKASEREPTLAPPKPTPDPLLEKVLPPQKLPAPLLELPSEPRPMAPLAPLPQNMNLPEPKQRIAPSYR